MATNKDDTLITVSIETRNKIRDIAKKEGRTMKGLLDVMVKEYESKKGK